MNPASHCPCHTSTKTGLALAARVALRTAFPRNGTLQGYEVVGLLNSGQSFDAQQEPLNVPIGVVDGDSTSSADIPKVMMFACGEQARRYVVVECSRGFVILRGLALWFGVLCCAHRFWSRRHGIPDTDARTL